MNVQNEKDNVRNIILRDTWNHVPKFTKLSINNNFLSPPRWILRKNTKEGSTKLQSRNKSHKFHNQKQH